MRLTLILHILAGAVAILSGFAALYAAKGARLHRRSGILFVGSMLSMCVGGVYLAVATNTAPAINVPAGLLCAYLVVTALTAVRPPRSGAAAIHAGAMAVAAILAVACIALGGDAIAAGGRRAGMAGPLFMFGGIALVGAGGDLKRLRAAPLVGAARLARHLWRMCTALAIAAMAWKGPARGPVRRRATLSARWSGAFAS